MFCVWKKAPSILPCNRMTQAGWLESEWGEFGKTNGGRAPFLTSITRARVQAVGRGGKKLGPN